VLPGTFENPFNRTSQPARVVALVPARYASTRFPGKALADLDGRSVIEHVYRRAAAARRVDAVVVATDDGRIAAAVARFGGDARMTASTHRSGTDRIAEVARGLSCEIVINVQGDEPLVDPADIDRIVDALDAPGAAPMAALRCPLDAAGRETPHVVKMVVDAAGRALAFSRAAEPAVPGDAGAPSRAVWKHVGLYGYRRDFLLRFAALPQTPGEIAQALEQLRALEHGHAIDTVETAHDSVGIDTPADLEIARRRLAASALPVR
jgi:3-deoxy-manno-octulosonate cytidylyltransferase (CMP-KDO synthetase)